MVVKTNKLFTCKEVSPALDVYYDLQKENDINQLVKYFHKIDLLIANWESEIRVHSKLKLPIDNFDYPTKRGFLEFNLGLL